MSSKLRWYCPYCGLWQPDTDACTRYGGRCAFPPRHEPPEAENLSERAGLIEAMAETYAAHKQHDEPDGSCPYCRAEDPGRIWRVEANDEALRQDVSENEDVRKYLALKALEEAIRVADSGTEVPG